MFKHILSKFHLFFFHQRLKKEETEAVTKEPTKDSDTAKVQRFVSNTGKMEVLLSHIHSIVFASAYF